MLSGCLLSCLAFCQLSSFVPNPNLLLGLSCWVSNETPKEVSIVQQVKLFHSLSWSLAPVRCGVLWRVCLCSGIVLFLLPSESEVMGFFLLFCFN